MDEPDWKLDALWQELRALELQVPKSGYVELSRSVRHLLRLVAPTVGVNNEELEAALREPESATALLRDMRARIRDGSDRIGDALDRMYVLQEAGEMKRARQEMLAVLSVEKVPAYREIAEGEIAKMDADRPDLPIDLPKRGMGRRSPAAGPKPTKTKAGKPASKVPGRKPKGTGKTRTARGRRRRTT